MLDLSKHIVFTIQNIQVVVSGELWEHTCSTLASGHSCCALVYNLGCQHGLQQSGVVCFWKRFKIGPHRQKAPRGVQSPAPELNKNAQRLQNVTQSDPRVTMWVLEIRGNGPRVLLFQITYKQHNDCTKILED